jgi:CheY-like chemotaxis protein
MLLSLPRVTLENAMKTILVVEDDEAFAYAASRALEKAGYAVISVRTTMAALREIEIGRTIDLVVTNIRMPPGQPHGFAFANMVQMKRSSMPIIFMTAFREFAEHARETDRVLYKPLG